jgi:hypothetical protein
MPYLTYEPRPLFLPRRLLEHPQELSGFKPDLHSLAASLEKSRECGLRFNERIIG